MTMLREVCCKPLEIAPMRLPVQILFPIALRSSFSTPRSPLHLVAFSGEPVPLSIWGNCNTAPKLFSLRFTEKKRPDGSPAIEPKIRAGAIRK